jgi:LysM repeat protein
VPLNGYDNVVKTGLKLAGLIKDKESKREGTSLVFENMSKGVKPRKIVLRGRAMPYKEVEYGVKQTVNTTWYPGNPVATQQILGPSLEPTEFNGAWKSRYIDNCVLVDGQNIGPDLERVTRLFANACLAGIQWKVSWVSEVRQGVISSFTPTWIRQTDVNWKMTIDWNSRDDEEESPLKIKKDKKAAKDLFKKLNKLLDTIAVGPLVAKQLVAMVVSDIRAIQETVSKAISILASVETILSAPAHIIGALKAAVAQLARQVNVAVRRIAGSTQASASAFANLSQTNNSTRTRTQAQSLVAGSAAYNPPAGIPDTTSDGLANGVADPTTNGLGAQSGGAGSVSAVSGQLEFESWRRDVAKQLYDILFSLQQAVSDVEERNAPPALRVVTAKNGDTLYTIAVREYGSPDYANWIAAANNLRSAILTPGMILRIPSRPSGASDEATIGSGDQFGPTGVGP